MLASRAPLREAAPAAPPDGGAISKPALCGGGQGGGGGGGDLQRPLLSDAMLEGVSALNTVASAFERVSKPSYHLVEQVHDAFEPDDSAIAVCDMDLLRGGPAERARFVRTLGDSLRDVGFAVLVNHGVAVGQEAHAEVRRFFTRHPPELKERFAAQRKGAVNQARASRAWISPRACA